MGKKHRRARRMSDDDEDDDNNVDELGGGESAESQQLSASSKSLNPNDKALDFAQRRELQRQAAQEKRRQKLKCYLCGKSGHVRRECPGIPDDGRGMSRYKGRTSDTKTAMAKRNHQKSLKQQSSSLSSQALDDIQLLELPEGFGSAIKKSDDDGDRDDGDDPDVDPFLYYDASCDVAATIEYCKTGRGKHKISLKEATAEYEQVLDFAKNQSNMGGFISRSWLKPNRPWISPLPDGQLQEPPLSNLFYYVVGLHRDFLQNDDHVEDAVQALLESVKCNSPGVVSVFCDLDYTDEYLGRTGCDKESQLRRLKATFEAAGQSNLTLQLRTLPGASSLPTTPASEEDGAMADDSIKNRVKGTPYAEVLLDVQTVIMESLQKYPKMKIHWSCWSGLAAHMVSLIQSIPDNLMVGLDGSCTFTKATDLHECAFELPMEKLVMETSTIIPSHVANTLGRNAFPHSGTLPFIAEAIAKLKKRVSAAEVARSASQNTLYLYPELSRASDSFESTDESPT